MATTLNIPVMRPKRPHFSSGPTAKRPGWSLDNLSGALLGRSHRSKPGKAKLREAIELTRTVLEVPAGYKIAIVPASDTGAVEMALWSMLGPRPVDVLAWESFGQGWASDIQKELKLKDVRVLKARYGALPEIASVDPKHDVVFTWNGTTSGVRVPNGDWITADRAGLTICDATSAAFAQALAWDKLDVVTFSWQKALGGEAAHGMLVLSPRAVERLESYTPPWPVPKIFRLTKSGKLIDAVFEGETINTPSLLCVEDWLDTLLWAQSVGGLSALVARADRNCAVLNDWVDGAPWIENLVQDPAIRSNTSVCLSIIDPWFVSNDDEGRRKIEKSFVGLLEKEGIAFDIGAHRDAPAGLRIWTGATVEAEDIKALTPWLDWAFAQVKGKSL